MGWDGLSIRRLNQSLVEVLDTSLHLPRPTFNHAPGFYHLSTEASTTEANILLL